MPKKRKNKMYLKPTESQITKAILEYLAYKDIFAWKVNSGMFFFKDIKTGKTRMFKAGLKGMSDIIGIIKGGIFLAIEVKVPKGKLTPDQKSFLDKIKQCGGISFVAHNIEEVEQKLKNII